MAVLGPRTPCLGPDSHSSSYSCRLPHVKGLPKLGNPSFCPQGSQRVKADPSTAHQEGGFCQLAGAFFHPT